MPITLLKIYSLSPTGYTLTFFIIMEAENGRPDSLLLAMPPETLIHILCYLDTDTLLLVELVCRVLKAPAREAYRTAYGLGPLHRDSTDFRALAIESYLLNRLHDDVYFWNNKDIRSFAADGLLALQRSSDRRADAWNEAVATALMAQGRYSEAKVFYKRMGESGRSLPEHTLLTGARWAWPFTKPLSLPVATSRPLLEKACVGAALRGDIDMLSDFRGHQISLDVVVSDHCPASAAASMGHVLVLGFLQKNGVDLARIRPSSLSKAVSNGQYEAAQFLLKAGARLDVPFGSSPSEIAMDKGDVAFLRLFAQHTAMNTFTSTSPLMRGHEDRIFSRYLRESHKRNSVSESGG